MFIGHFALGFAAKQATPRLSLAWLFVAAQLADLLWPAFLLVGVEQVRIDRGNTAFTPLDFVSYPYSHSLLFLVIWGVALGRLCGRVVRDRRIVPVIVALVLSHWLLDFVTHRPDLPLYPGGRKFGLGLWNSVPATLAVEAGMYIVGLWMYVRATRPRDAIGRWAFISFALFLMVVYLANLFGPPPPSVLGIAVTGIAGGAVLLLWARWLDGHRQPIL